VAQFNNDAEKADVSQSLHKKQMLQREYNDEDDAFSTMSQMVCPTLLLLLVMKKKTTKIVKI
jgi:hypothetical protein